MRHPLDLDDDDEVIGMTEAGRLLRRWAFRVRCLIDIGLLDGYQQGPGGRYKTTVRAVERLRNRMVVRRRSLSPSGSS